VKADISTDYFWYNAGKINHNQGAYSGKLIHGKYEVFDHQRRLLTLGNFSQGLKEGRWIHWSLNGKIQEICTFRKGKLEGTLTTYKIDGDLLTELKYKNGLLNGKSRYYPNDTVLIRKYRKGKIVPVKNHRSRVSDKNKLDPELIKKEEEEKSPAKRRML
jgi:antitoxin component YwqK of YwqJK toxin-antitoxin module